MICAGIATSAHTGLAEFDPFHFSGRERSNQLAHLLAADLVLAAGPRGLAFLLDVLAQLGELGKACLLGSRWASAGRRPAHALRGTAAEAARRWTGRCTHHWGGSRPSCARPRRRLPGFCALAWPWRLSQGLARRPNGQRNDEGKAMTSPHDRNLRDLYRRDEGDSVTNSLALRIMPSNPATRRQQIRRQSPAFRTRTRYIAATKRRCLVSPGRSHHGAL